LEARKFGKMEKVVGKQPEKGGKWDRGTWKELSTLLRKQSGGDQKESVATTPTEHKVNISEGGILGVINQILLFPGKSKKKRERNAKKRNGTG